ncbi:PhoU domain-containing protein, partial [Thermus thermophilus]|uniref:PhoU domain-containing protein n=1 Tax=Thermus thermophilus TaxID=274 RepID=UPI0003D7A3C6
ARLAPSPKPLAPKYLRPEALNDPLLAQGLALRELARIGDAARHMLEGVLKALVQETGHEAELLPLEEKVDRLSREVLVYVAKLPQDTPALPLLKAASELEHLADLAKRALRKAERLWTQGVTFSPEGKAELARIVGRTLARLERALTALATGNRALAERVLAEYPEVLAEVEASREAHLRRLRDRVETRASTLTHLDLLLLLEELNLGVNRLALLVEEIHKEG